MSTTHSNVYGTYRGPQPSTSKFDSPLKFRKRLDFEFLLGSPFFITSTSIAVIGWITAFFASIVSSTQTSNFSHFAWWCIIYQLCVIIGVTITICVNSIDAYKIAIVGFLSSALSFSSSTANTLIYSTRAADQAAAAGHIFLCITNITWIFYFGTTGQAGPHAWVDSYSMLHAPVHNTGIYSPGAYGTPYPKTFEQRVSVQPSIQQSLQRSSVQRSSVVEIGEFRYRAKALYTYDANPEDPNEISFVKGEILEIADISGKWFHAKNQKGETGIAPSNYLILQTDDFPVIGNQI